MLEGLVVFGRTQCCGGTVGSASTGTVAKLTVI